MEKKKKAQIMVTISLSLIEAVIYYILLLNNKIYDDSWIITFMSYAMPMGFLCCINYYLLSPVLIYLGQHIWHLLGHYGYISKKFQKIAAQCIAWLVNTNLHWGVVDSATECQNANICEGLLAIKKTGLDLRYSSIYQEALNDVLSNVTDKGLSSKSLNHETVVCTSMILYLYALEKENNANNRGRLDDKMEHVANNLWSVRGNKGWGVYIEKTKDSDCSIANTFWALRALNKYGVAQDKKFYHMVRRIYENSNNSLFGYVSGDYPRLSTTAMSIILYYNLEESIREKIDEVYSVDKAIAFVYKQFCIRGLECELEILQGLEVKSKGVKKAPWTHVTVSFAIEALIYAFKNKKIGVSKMNILIERIKIICKRQLVYINGDKQQCYYIPKNMELRNDGIFTFPTAYFAWGLSKFDF